MLRSLAVPGVVAIALSAGCAARAATVQPLEGGQVGVTFPRGSPAPEGRGEVLWIVRDGAETFLAGSIPTPSNPDLVKGMRGCPPPMDNAQGKLSCRTWDVKGDLTKETETDLPSGDVVIVRLLFHGDRAYEAMYTRRGGSGRASPDARAFLDSLHPAQ